MKYMNKLPEHPGNTVRVIRSKDRELVEAVMYHYKNFHKKPATWAVVEVEGETICVDLTIGTDQKIPQRA